MCAREGARGCARWEKTFTFGEDLVSGCLGVWMLSLQGSTLLLW